MTLTQGDCFELIKKVPSGSVDLVLADPPYVISRKTNFASGKPTGKEVDRFRVSMEFGEWDMQEVDMLPLIKEAYRVLKRGGTMICFYDLWKLTTLRNCFEEAGFKQLRFMEWIKTNPVPLNSKTNYLTNAREIMVSGVKGGKPTFNSEYDNGVYKYPICHGSDRVHPTQKPVSLMRELIIKHSNPSDVVLDPFMGSGSTGVACVNCGRDFIGIEKDEGYFRIAEERIRKAEEEQMLAYTD